MRLRIYSKPDCHLCETAKTIVQRVAAEARVPLEEINIETDPEACEQFQHEIPVLFLDDIKLFKYHVDEQKLRKALTARGN